MDFGAHLLLSFIYISITTDSIRHQLATGTSSTYCATADILRYTFAGNSSLLPPDQRKAADTVTLESQLELWNSALYRLCTNTSYNSSFFLCADYHPVHQTKQKDQFALEGVLKGRV